MIYFNSNYVMLHRLPNIAKSIKMLVDIFDMFYVDYKNE